MEYFTDIDAGLTTDPKKVFSYGTDSKKIRYLQYLYYRYPRFKAKTDEYYSGGKSFVLEYEDVPEMSYGDFERLKSWSLRNWK